MSRPQPTSLTMRGLKTTATVLSKPCKVICTLHTEFDRTTDSHIDTVSIEFIVDPDGQEITTNMLSYDEHQKLLSTLRQKIKPL